MKDRDRDIVEIVQKVKDDPHVGLDAMYLVALLALICKAVRDLKTPNWGAV